MYSSCIMRLLMFEFYMITQSVGSSCRKFSQLGLKPLHLMLDAVALQHKRGLHSQVMNVIRQQLMLRSNIISNNPPVRYRSIFQNRWFQTGHYKPSIHYHEARYYRHGLRPHHCHQSPSPGPRHCCCCRAEVHGYCQSNPAMRCKSISLSLDK